MQQAIVESYSRLKNLKLVGKEVGMPFQSVYLVLRKAGVSVTGDKSRYGSETDRLAAGAEREFMSLVPDAKNMNEVQFQSKIDFDVHGVTVDVKSSRLHQGTKKFDKLRWAFSVKKQEFVADFIVCFAYNKDGTYRTFLIPGEFIRHYQTISIAELGKSKWLDFEIAPGELAQFFDEAKHSSAVAHIHA